MYKLLGGGFLYLFDNSAVSWASSSCKESSILKGGVFALVLLYWFLFVVFCFVLFHMVNFFSKVWTSCFCKAVVPELSDFCFLIQCQLSSLFLFPVSLFLISLVWSLICKRSLGYCQKVLKIATLGYIIHRNLAVGEAEEQLEQYSCLLHTSTSHFFLCLLL